MWVVDPSESGDFLWVFDPGICVIKSRFFHNIILEVKGGFEGVGSNSMTGPTMLTSEFCGETSDIMSVQGFSCATSESMSTDGISMECSVMLVVLAFEGMYTSSEVSDEASSMTGEVTVVSGGMSRDVSETAGGFSRETYQEKETIWDMYGEVLDEGSLHISLSNALNLSSVTNTNPSHADFSDAFSEVFGPVDPTVEENWCGSLSLGPRIAIHLAEIIWDTYEAGRGVNNEKVMNEQLAAHTTDMTFAQNTKGKNANDVVTFEKLQLKLQVRNMNLQFIFLKLQLKLPFN